MTPLAFIATVALACVITGALAGCILPDGLQVEGDDNGPNNQPVIRSGIPDFMAGSFSPGEYSDAWTFSVTVFDADPPGSESLEARLYFLQGSVLLPLPGSIPLTSSPSAPNTWTGETTPTQWCKILTLPRTPLINVFYVYVSDAGFPATGDPKALAAGHFDYSEWVIICP